MKLEKGWMTLKFQVLKADKPMSPSAFEHHPHCYFSHHWGNSFSMFIFEVDGTFIHCFIHRHQNLIFMEYHEEKTNKDNIQVNEYLTSTFDFSLEKKDKFSIETEGKTQQEIALQMLLQIIYYDAAIVES
jgi:hypothetical protein